MCFLFIGKYTQERMYIIFSYLYCIQRKNDKAFTSYVKRKSSFKKSTIFLTITFKFFLIHEKMLKITSNLNDIISNEIITKRSAITINMQNHHLDFKSYNQEVIPFKSTNNS